MVRLFVPECEGDHLLTRRRNNPLVTDSHVVDTPWRSTVGALGVSALLALVGRARPGTFLKTTAYLSTANIAISAFDMYGHREINRAIFKLDKIEHKPGKLWERTKHWTVEDLVIAGGILGMCLAINPGALPGVYGWKRFLGAATVGAALGGNVGETYVAGMVPEVRQAIQEIDDAHRNAQYDRLLAQPDALQSLSRFGRLAFVIHCLPEIRLPRFQGEDELHIHQDVVIPITDEKDVPTFVVAEFNHGELKGPDLEHGSRSYKDDPPSWNISELEEWLKSLQDHRNINAAEARYLWQTLAEREEQFYKMRDDDHEKDIVRRKLQLLDNVSSERAMKDALFAYHIADIQKRLEQARNNGTSKQGPLLSHEIVKLGPTDGAVETFDFQNFANSIEISWKRQRRDLAQTERHTNMLSKLTLEPGSPEEATFKEFKHQLEIKKKNFEATEKLLREFEELAHAASEKRRIEVASQEKKE